MLFTKNKLHLAVVLLNLSVFSTFASAQTIIKMDGSSALEFSGENAAIDGDNIYSSGYGIQINDGTSTIKNTTIQAKENGIGVSSGSFGDTRVDIENVMIKYDKKEFQDALNKEGISGTVANQPDSATGIELAGSSRARVVSNIKDTNVNVAGNALLTNNSTLDIKDSTFTSQAAGAYAIKVNGGSNLTLTNVKLNSAEQGLYVKGKDLRNTYSNITWNGGEINVDYQHKAGKQVTGIYLWNAATTELTGLDINLKQNDAFGQSGTTNASGIAIIHDDANLLNPTTTLKDIKISTNEFATGSIGLLANGSAVTADNLTVNVLAHSAVGVVARGSKTELNITNSTINMGQKDGHFSTSAVLAEGGSKVNLEDSIINITSVKGRAFDIKGDSTVTINNTDINAGTNVGNNDPIIGINGGTFIANNSTFTIAGDDRTIFSQIPPADEIEKGKTNTIQVTNVTATLDGKNTKFLDTGYGNETTFEINKSKFLNADIGFQTINNAKNNITATDSEFTANTQMFRVNNAEINATFTDSTVKSNDLLIQTAHRDGLINLTANNTTLQGKVDKFTGLLSRTGKTNITMTDKSKWITPTGSNLDNLTLKDSSVEFIDHAPGNIITINKLDGAGDSYIKLSTVFNDDSSATDKIIINGSAAGTTGLQFVQAGGTGAQTVNGILVVDAVNNATTATDAFYLHSGSINYRAPESTKDASIVIGAYDYYLVRGLDASKSESNWYLSSEKNKSVDPVDPNNDTPYRPEVDAYLANLQLANNLQRHKWQDRRGQTLNQDTDSVAWIRVQADKSSFNNQFDYKRKTTSELIHFGTDVWRQQLADGSRLDVGVMGLLGKGENKARNQHTKAKSSLDSYNVGAYATWQQKPTEHAGAYVDSWLMYGWVDNKVKGDGLSGESYKTKASSASVEAGYAFALDQQQSWYLQPQAQVIWAGHNGGSHKEKNGTQVKWQSDNYLTSRIGARLFADLDMASTTRLQPFVEANYWNYGDSNKIMFNSERIKDKTPSNAVELSLGLQATTKNNVDIWTRVSAEKGNRQYRHINGQVGITYNW